MLFATAIAASGCSTDYGDGATYVRLANLAPGPATELIDFCIAKVGTLQYEGPILELTPTTTDPVGTGLSYGMVSKYFAGTAGSYNVRVLRYGTGSCATRLVPDSLVPFAPGGTTTVALAGLAGSTGPALLQVKTFVDEWAQDPSNAKIRFVNASPGLPSTDVGLRPVASFTPIWTDLGWLEIASTSDAPPVDVNGFATVPPPGRIALLVVTACATPPPPYSAQTCTETLLGSAVVSTLGAGSVTSAFLVGVPGDATYPPRILWCADREGPVPETNLSDCMMVP
jgi:hypothetical protein